MVDNPWRPVFLVNPTSGHQVEVARFAVSPATTLRVPDHFEKAEFIVHGGLTGAPINNSWDGEQVANSFGMSSRIRELGIINWAASVKMERPKPGADAWPISSLHLPGATSVHRGPPANSDHADMTVLVVAALFNMLGGETIHLDSHDIEAARQFLQDNPSGIEYVAVRDPASIVIRIAR